MIEDDLIATIEFSLHKALLGEIIPSLRAVSYTWNKESKLITLFFFHDGEVTPSIEDHYSSIAAETDCAYFGKGIKLDHVVVRCDYPNQIHEKGRITYKRKEPF